MTNEIWLGSGTSVTFVPETDLFIGFNNISADVTTGTVVANGKTTALNGLTSYAMGNNEDSVVALMSATCLMTPGIYAGCVASFSVGGVITNLRIVTNDTLHIYVAGTAALNPVVTAATNHIIIQSYGAPVFAPKNSTNPHLLSDNWLGLVTTITPPNLEVEMKQMNLALGGTRNWTHQYKGIETTSGGSMELNVNTGIWLYYALGHLTSIVKPSGFAAATVFSPVVASLIVSTPDNTAALTSETYIIDNTLLPKDGPFFHRVVSDGANAIVCPPVLPSETHSEFRVSELPTIASNEMTLGMLYTFEEANSSELPSFTLEHTVAKSAPTTALTVDAAGAEVFTRFYTGNRVNTLTMTAAENMELTMSLDLNSKTTLKAPTGYQSRRGVTDETLLSNFRDDKTEFITPFMFSDGTISLFNQDYIRMTNMTLTINNNLQDKRFIGNYSKAVKEALPAQRTYELTFSGYVTDEAIYRELISDVEQAATATDASRIKLHFQKDDGETIKLEFHKYMLTTNTWPIPDDKGPIQIEMTIMPLRLTTCQVNSHWHLMG
tara:strand:- start:44390 stop:46042 length:1653 start_codon:yes stop_codon:yes gene_type:complete